MPATDSIRAAFAAYVDAHRRLLDSPHCERARAECRAAHDAYRAAREALS